ncbi:MAG: ATPase [Chloroflexi bacterium]|nr:MAG: ATPase [Chloroflexota bacterium]
MLTELPPAADSALGDWLVANQRYIAAGLARLRELLNRRSDPASDASDDLLWMLDAARPTTGPPAILDRLRVAFGLSQFEADILLLCAAQELDGSFSSLLAGMRADNRPAPSFGLALAALPGAHWSALTPDGPLRRWELIELGASFSITDAPLRIDERILHELAGSPHLDARLTSYVESVRGDGPISPSQQRLACEIADAWRASRSDQVLPAIQLCGPEHGDKPAIAVAACARLGLRLWRAPLEALPNQFGELEAFARRWTREALLSSSALLLDADRLDPSDPQRLGLLDLLLERIDAPVLVSTRERMRYRRPTLAIDARKPDRAEQRALWRASLNGYAMPDDDLLEHLVTQFDLSAAGIAAAGVEAQGRVLGGDLRAATEVAWDASRVLARPRLDDLAQRIEPAAHWDDLVLPEQQIEILREVSIHVRRRAIVYDRWGFAKKGTRGLGISALFSGASGTGKTTAAEVLANDLRLDLYRVDLSAMVSKYIGETEKNLRRVFDAAEDGGTILLFDEADALFGKRSEVKDSHDRYANIEVSYLLQRMEAFRGLAILTTNMKSSLDPAFMRRIRFIVHFPFPDAAQRAEIWRRIFPADTPTYGLVPELLARLSIPGGSIRNIALNAAFIAADRGEPVQMQHVLIAARSEYAKLEKTLTDGEIAGWL